MPSERRCTVVGHMNPACSASHPRSPSEPSTAQLCALILSSLRSFRLVANRYAPSIATPCAHATGTRQLSRHLSPVFSKRATELPSYWAEATHFRSGSYDIPSAETTVAAPISSLIVSRPIARSSLPESRLFPV